MCKDNISPNWSNNQLIRETRAENARDYLNKLTQLGRIDSDGPANTDNKWHGIWRRQQTID